VEPAATGGESEERLAVLGADEASVPFAIEQFRPAHAIEIAYAHMTAVATKEKRKKNREFIILAGEMLR
jgi:hypothetical protein